MFGKSSTRPDRANSQIPDEIARAIRWIPRFSLRPSMLRVARPLISALVPRANLHDVEVLEIAEDGIRMRILRPAGRPAQGLMMWIHGGGLIVGRPSDNDGRCADMVRALGVAIVLPYYRLAPEHPFPAGLDDCIHVWDWLQVNHGRTGVPSPTAAIGGESAGGGLAAAVSQKLRDRGGQQPVCQNLVYPMLDDRTAARRQLDKDRHLVWNNRSNCTGWSSYLGNAPGAASTLPYSVPARCADLAGLPPAWIGVGDQDLFWEEDREYARRLNEAGVECELHEVNGGYHGFDILAYGSSLAELFRQRQFAFLARHLRIEFEAN